MKSKGVTGTVEGVTYRTQGEQNVIRRALFYWHSSSTFKQSYQDQYWGKQRAKYFHDFVDSIGQWRL